MLKRQIGWSRQFLNLQVTEWINDESFREMKDFVKYPKVTNEPAERGIKLVSDFSNTLTENNTQRGNIIQVV